MRWTYGIILFFFISLIVLALRRFFFAGGFRGLRERIMIRRALKAVVQEETAEDRAENFAAPYITRYFKMDSGETLIYSYEKGVLVETRIWSVAQTKERERSWREFERKYGLKDGVECVKKPTP